MTSTVTISAHCGDAKEVHVVVTEAGSLVEEFNIANGEKAERYAYDDRVIAVREVVKIDRRAKEIEDAEFSLRQATLRYEDAASRRFPLGNEALLKADVVAKHGALDVLTAPAVNLAPAFDPAAHALMSEPILATPSDAGYETKTYADGTVATGIGPLPDQSPAEQDALELTGTGAGEMSPEAKTFLDSLEPAPLADMANPGMSEH
ncbi:MAG: hypothetical protein PHW66_09530 [Gallionella sp.]|nr:hypothetical protein [Gallionella sp.]